MSALELVALGGLLGAVGQAVRVVVGAKKLGDRAAENKTSFTEEFSPSQLVVSLIIGFTAGVLAALGITAVADSVADGAQGQAIASLSDLNRQSMLGIMAAGYAGTDFIEGFAKKHLPQGKPAADAPKPAPVGPASAEEPEPTQPPAMG